LWAQRDAKGARGIWAGTGGAAEIALARAAAQGGAQLVDTKSLRRVADDASLAPELSPRTRRYLIEIYTAAGAPDKALAVTRAADLGMASFVERFKAVKGTAKSINLYDLALLTDLTRLYRELARRQLELAAADARMKPSAEYYLAEVLSGLGASDEAATYVQAFLARAQTPVQYRERARVRQALIAYRQGRRAEAESAWTATAESSSDPLTRPSCATVCWSAARTSCRSRSPRRPSHAKCARYWTHRDQVVSRASAGFPPPPLSLYISVPSE